MLVPINFVGSAANDLTPESARLPSLAWSAFALFGKVHSAWRWYRHVELYSNPKNFAHLLAGHLVDYVIGDRLLVKIAAHSLLIATRLLECAQAQAEVQQSGKELLDALNGRYPLPIKEKWPTAQTEMFGLSPSTVAWWNTSCKSSHEKIKRIGSCILNLIYKSFELCMRIADAVDAFYLSPEAQSHSVHACFVNAARLLEVISENKEELLMGISNNKQLIERIIDHSPFSYERLYKAVSNTLDTVETANYYSNKVSAFTQNGVQNFGKRALNGGMVVLGFGDHRPLGLLGH